MAATSNLYPQLDITYEEFQETVESFNIKTQTMNIKSETDMNTLRNDINKSKANCLIFQIEENADLMSDLVQMVDDKFVNHISIFMGRIFMYLL